MAIPDFQSTMLPLLKYLSDGNEHSNQDIYEALENQFHMTEEEKKELLPSGKQRVFVNRVAWAKSYLKQADLVEAVRRGYYRITESGKDIIFNHCCPVKKRLDTRKSQLGWTMDAFPTRRSILEN